MAARPAARGPTPDARVIRDLERCKRPTRAYPRWCNELEKERVTPRIEARGPRPEARGPQ